jgi:hypothetical protein
MQQELFEREPLLEDVFTYDPDTGLFKWVEPTGLRQKGWFIQNNTLSTKGYCRIAYKGKDIKAHRLAWYLMTGSFPKDQIDHKNGIKTDNRFSNLREATNSQNAQNKTCTGAYLSKDTNKWISSIKVDSKKTYLGSFNTKEEAMKAYKEAKKKYHPFWIKKE